MSSSKWKRIVLDKGTSHLFLTPALIILLVLLVGPFIYMVSLSFTDLSFSQPDRDGNFVGFANYRKLMRDDPIFWESFLKCSAQPLTIVNRMIIHISAMFFFMMLLL